MKLRIFIKIIIIILLVNSASTTIARNNYRLLKTYFQQPIHPTLQLPSMKKVTQPLVVEQGSNYAPLSNQQFDNTVTLQNIMLKQPIEITASQFNQKVLFTDIKYRKDVNIDLSTFNDVWEQRQSKAYKSFKLYAVTFKGNTNFVRNIVRGNMAASQCHFNAPVNSPTIDLSYPLVSKTIHLKNFQVLITVDSEIQLPFKTRYLKNQ